MDYRNKVILAPMVRVGTLPMRLLALEYGADLVYTEELIDWKLLTSERVVNPILNTVDFIDPNDGTIIFQTHPDEKGRVILQIGTSDEERALKVGKLVENDVAAIDINMGCPKEFSVKGGMGVALLHNPDKAKAILRRLVKELKIPVTCKIRLLSDLDASIKLVKEFAEIGISAIAIHGRTRDERPQHTVRVNEIKAIIDSGVSIPVICNGGSRDMDRYQDIQTFLRKCGASSVMVARAAQINCSIFRKKGPLPIDDVIVAYLRKCIQFLHQPTKTKYCVQSLLRDLQETPRGKQFLETQTLEQMCQIWNLDGEYRQTMADYVAKGYTDLRTNTVERYEASMDQPAAKKLKLIANSDNEEKLAFIRANYSNTDELPKSVMFNYAVKNKILIPTYNTCNSGKLFRSVCNLNGKSYSTSYWEKNKKCAEQGAALAAMLDLGLIEKETLKKNGSLLS